MSVGSRRTINGVIVRGASGMAKGPVRNIMFRMESGSKGILSALAASGGNRTRDGRLPVYACGRSKSFGRSVRCAMIRAGTISKCVLSRATRSMALQCSSGTPSIIMTALGLIGMPARPGLPRANSGTGPLLCLKVNTLTLVANIKIKLHKEGGGGGRWRLALQKVWTDGLYSLLF